MRTWRGITTENRGTSKVRDIYELDPTDPGKAWLLIIRAGPSSALSKHRAIIAITLREPLSDKIQRVRASVLVQSDHGYMLPELSTSKVYQQTSEERGAPVMVSFEEHKLEGEERPRLFLNVQPDRLNGYCSGRTEPYLELWLELHNMNLT